MTVREAITYGKIFDVLSTVISDDTNISFISINGDAMPHDNDQDIDIRSAITLSKEQAIELHESLGKILGITQ